MAAAPWLLMAATPDRAQHPLLRHVLHFQEAARSCHCQRRIGCCAGCWRTGGGRQGCRCSGQSPREAEVGETAELPSASWLPEEVGVAPVLLWSLWEPGLRASPSPACLGLPWYASGAVRSSRQQGAA